MIPLRSTTPLAVKPVVTLTLLTVNLVVFLGQLLSGPRGEVLIRVFGFVPSRFFHPQEYGLGWLDVLPTLLTSLMLHGGLVHLAGNMLYLWIFGSGVEGRLGHARFLIFYLLCGAIGSLTHAALYPHSPIPSIGASGSIAGILGAFLVLQPRARIITLIPLVVSWAMVEIPALVLLPLWFLMQFLNGFLALMAARGTVEVASVAWWAHIGGFVFGALAAGFSLLRRRG